MKSLKIDTKKKFKHYGEKIKKVVFHPTQPLLLAGQFDGKATIFNYEQQTVAKQIEVSDKPLRCVEWLPEDRILVTGDDLQVRIFCFHTTQKLYQFQAHNDFIRRAIQLGQSRDILTCSDDKSIALWSLETGKESYAKKREWREHGHFVMDLKVSPKEEGMFASASLDKTIKLWHVQGESSNGTLRGHQAGVNCIDYYGRDKQLLVSGADDMQVIVWDLTSKAQLRSVKHHQGNVMDVVFLEKTPFFCSVAEDGYLNFYGVNNYEFQFDVVNFMNKGWSLSAKGNLLAAAYDEGCVVLRVGSERPVSSASKGKLVWSVNGEVFQCNLKALLCQESED